MPSFEKMKSAEFVAAPVVGKAPAEKPAADTVAVPFTAVFETPAPAPAPVEVETDPELRQMIEARDVQMLKKRSRTSVTVSLALLAIVAATGTWVVVSPTARNKAKALVAAMQQSGKDIKGLASILGTYEKQLDKVAVHGARLDSATVALGADPDADTSAQDAQLNEEMKKMSGDEGPTTMDRDAKLKGKFGIVGKLAGKETDKVPAAESDVKF